MVKGGASFPDDLVVDPLVVVGGGKINAVGKDILEALGKIIGFGLGVECLISSPIARNQDVTKNYRIRIEHSHL